MAGILDPVGDSRGQAQKIFGVPGVDNFGPGFERAVAEDRVVDRAAGKIGGGGRFHHFKILPLVKGDHRQPLPDVTQEKHRFVAAYAARAWQTSEDGVNLGQAVRAATGGFLSEAQEEIDAGSMVLMVCVKRGHEHRRIK